MKTDMLRHELMELFTYSVIARRDSMDVKCQNVHSVYERRLAKILRLVDIVEKESIDVATAIHKQIDAEIESRVSMDSSLKTATPTTRRRLSLLTKRPGENKNEPKPEPKPKPKPEPEPKPKPKSNLERTRRTVAKARARTEYKQDAAGYTIAIGINHGTVTGYSYYACRCAMCRAAKSESNRRTREKKRQRQALELATNDSTAEKEAS